MAKEKHGNLSSNIATYRRVEKLAPNGVLRYFPLGNDDEVPHDAYPGFNPVGYYMQRGGSHLLWCWMMKERGVTFEEIVENRVPEELFQTAAYEVNKHLMQYSDDPDYETLDSSENGRKYCAELLDTGMKEVEKYIHDSEGKSKFDGLNPDSPFVDLSRPGLLHACSFIQDIVQEAARDVIAPYIARIQHERESQLPNMPEELLRYDPQRQKTYVNNWVAHIQDQLGIPGLWYTHLDTMNQEMQALENDRADRDHLVTAASDIIALSLLNFVSAKLMREEKEQGHHAGDLSFDESTARSAEMTMARASADMVRFDPADHPLSRDGITAMASFIAENRDSEDPRLRDEAELKRQTLLYLLHDVEHNGSLYRTEYDEEDSSYTIHAQGNVPRMDKLMRGLQKNGLHLTDVSFYDAEMNPVTLAEAFADPPENGQILVREKGGSVVRAFNMTSGALVDRNADLVPDGQPSPDAGIAVRSTLNALKLQYEELDAHDHFYVRSKENFRTMKETFGNVLRQAEAGADPAALSEAVSGLQQRVGIYLAGKRAEYEAGRTSSNAEERVAAAMRLGANLEVLQQQLTVQIGGPVRADLVKKAESFCTDRAAIRALSESRGVAALCAQAAAAQERLMERMNNGQGNGALSVEDCRALCSYARLARLVRTNDPSLAHIAAHPDELTAGQPVDGELRAFVTDTFTETPPSGEEGRAYGQKALDRCLDRLGYRLGIMDPASGLEEDEKQEKLGRMTRDEQADLDRLKQQGIVSDDDVKRFRAVRSMLGDEERIYENHCAEIRSMAIRGGHPVNADAMNAADRLHETRVSGLSSDRVYVRVKHALTELSRVRWEQRVRQADEARARNVQPGLQAGQQGPQAGQGEARPEDGQRQPGNGF